MATRKRIRKIYSPLVWPAWIVVGIGWLIARLPLRFLWAIGRGLGTLLYRLGGNRRRITEINVELCLPELSPEERERLVRSNFRHVAMGGVELLIPWLNPRRDLSGRFDIEGAEHLEAAFSRGRGVILVGAHFAVMDVISQPLSGLGPIDLMYRFNKHPVWEWLQLSGRATSSTTSSSARTPVKCSRTSRLGARSGTRPIRITASSTPSSRRSSASRPLRSSRRLGSPSSTARRSYSCGKLGV